MTAVTVALPLGPASVRAGPGSADGPGSSPSGRCGRTSGLCHARRVPAARALTLDTLGAWLVKTRGASPSTRASALSGFAGVTTRCVRPSYRTELVAAGQPVLLWVSGAEADHPAGIHAYGRTTGPVVDGVMPMSLTPLDVPVLRSELVGHPDLSALEVVRMPAGSNPTYVTRAQLALLRELGVPGF